MRSVCLAIALACAPAPALADEFCDALTAIVSQASTNFESIRGEPSARNRDAYDTPLIVIPEAVLLYPGSPPCSVRHTMTAVGQVYMYSCAFRDATTRAEQASVRQALTDRIGACLGVDMTAVRVSGAAPASYQLENARIQMWQQNHPDGGWGRIMVSVSPPTW